MQLTVIIIIIMKCQSVNQGLGYEQEKKVPKIAPLGASNEIERESCNYLSIRSIRSSGWLFEQPTNQPTNQQVQMKNKRISFDLFFWRIKKIEKQIIIGK